jgi:hypothetical protein
MIGYPTYLQYSTLAITFELAECYISKEISKETLNRPSGQNQPKF